MSSGPVARRTGVHRGTALARQEYAPAPDRPGRPLRSEAAQHARALFWLDTIAEGVADEPDDDDPDEAPAPDRLALPEGSNL
jgi:hypothetical protein